MKKNIPFNDLNRLHQPIRANILTSIGNLIDNSSFVLGEEVKKLEQMHAQKTGVDYAVGVASGFDALKVALLAAQIGPGDEVLVPAHTFVATAFAVNHVGATPVFVDIETPSNGIDPSLLENSLTNKTKAIIPVHLYGQPASMDKILSFAKNNSLLVIEDVAQAQGAMYKEKLCGSMGLAGCFSFYPGKILGAMGEGGMITTSDPDFYKRACAMRDVGQTEKGKHEYIGVNSRLQPFQAAVLNAKYESLTEQLKERNELANKFLNKLSDIKQIILPEISYDRTHVYHLFVILLKDEATREKLQLYLANNGVQTGRHYPQIVPTQSCYSDLGHKAEDFPVASRVCRSSLSLPFFIGMTDEEVDYVCSLIAKFYMQP